ncbi:unnamed protein product [Chrysoparadoxa australica]
MEEASRNSATPRRGHGKAPMYPHGERGRRSSLGLALAYTQDKESLGASVTIGEDSFEFASSDVRVTLDGLYIDGVACSDLHQDDLRITKVLGRGACSVVKKAQHLETRMLYAVKVFTAYDKVKRDQLLQEIKTLAEIDCPGIVEFYGAFLKDGNIHLILEFMDKGSLTDVIHGWKDVEYDEQVMAAMTYQVLWGMAYLTYEQRLHRDIKPQNILVNCRGEVKLSDFGIARLTAGPQDLSQTMVGTIRYMSPERLAGTGYGAPSDVWSFGVVLLEMAMRDLPFMRDVNQIDLHDMLEQMDYEQLIEESCGNVSASFKEVLLLCLQPDPQERATAQELLDMPFFHNNDIEELDHAVEVMEEWLMEVQSKREERKAAEQSKGKGRPGMGMGLGLGTGMGLSGITPTGGGGMMATGTQMITTMMSEGGSSDEESEAPTLGHSGRELQGLDTPWAG